jgi:hypothetical protein
MGLPVYADGRIILFFFATKCGSVYNVVLSEVSAEFLATMTSNCGGEVVEEREKFGSNECWWVAV